MKWTIDFNSNCSKPACSTRRKLLALVAHCHSPIHSTRTHLHLFRNQPCEVDFCGVYGDEQKSHRQIPQGWSSQPHSRYRLWMTNLSKASKAADILPLHPHLIWVCLTIGYPENWWSLSLSEWLFRGIYPFSDIPISSHFTIGFFTRFATQMLRARQVSSRSTSQHTLSSRLKQLLREYVQRILNVVGNEVALAYIGYHRLA